MLADESVRILALGKGNDLHGGPLLQQHVRRAKVARRPAWSMSKQVNVRVNAGSDSLCLGAVPRGAPRVDAGGGEADDVEVALHEHRATRRCSARQFKA